MVKSVPYGLAVAVVASTLALVGTGAALTSAEGSSRFSPVHQSAAIVVALFTVFLGIRIRRTSSVLAGALIGLILLLAVPVGESASFRILHASVAQALFACTWAAAVLTSAARAQAPSIVEDGGFPSLKSLSTLAAGVTAMQVVFGAAFRHGAMSIVPHVVGAIVTTVILLVLATFTITQFPKHAALAKSAWAVIAVVTFQVALGVIAFLGRLNQPEGAVPSDSLVASTVAHVVVGALTLASTVALALQVRYHVRPRAAVGSGLPVAS